MTMLRRTFVAGSRKKMLWLLGTLVALVVLDGILTELLLANGLARESNPLLQPLVGDTVFMVLKIAGAVLCSLILWDVYRHWPRLAVIATWCAVFVYSGIVLWNASLFLLG